MVCHLYIQEGVMCRTQKEMSLYMFLQRMEMLGPINMYFAGLTLGRRPTKDEAILHYIYNGGAKDFSRRWKQSQHYGTAN